MKAIRAHSYGSPDVLVYENVPTPQPAAGQVLIRVEAVAVNYSDIMRRSNTPYPFPTSLPYTPGGEVAGVVEAWGDGVTEPPIGTPVFALVGSDGSGGYAQYAIANAAQIIPIPPGLDVDRASGLVIAGATAVLLLKEVAGLKAGESVLVQGAAGGVGSYAVQIAKLMGAGMVIGAVSSPAKMETARSLGADQVVDYSQSDWAAQVRDMTDGRGVDVVLEMNGGEHFGQSLACLAPFGRAVVYGMASRQPLQLDRDTILSFFYNPALNQALHVFNLGLYFGLRPQAAVAALHDLIGYVVSGQVKVAVSHALPLSHAAEAHRMVEERRTTGKIILKPWADA